MEKQWIDPKGGCGAPTLTPLIYSMKLNLLMERETAWLCCFWLLLWLFSLASFFPFLFILPSLSSCWCSRALTMHLLCFGLWDLSQGNVWVWIFLHLRVYKKDLCLTWWGFSTERWIPADCWNSFICLVVVPGSKLHFSFSSAEIRRGKWKNTILKQGHVFPVCFYSQWFGLLHAVTVILINSKM